MHYGTGAVKNLADLEFSAVFGGKIFPSSLRSSCARILLISCFCNSVNCLASCSLVISRGSACQPTLASHPSENIPARDQPTAGPLNTLRKDRQIERNGTQGSTLYMWVIIFHSLMT